MVDQQIGCATCGRGFTWTAGEQEFFRKRGLSAPRHCPDCRAARRQQAPPSPTRAQQAPAPRPSMVQGRRRRPSPFAVFGLAAVAALALLGALALYLRASPLVAWLLAINAVAIVAYMYDKLIAGGERMRVPEVVLLGLALAGGSPAAFVAMLLLRHKVSKPAFLLPFALVVVLQVGLILAWLWLRQGA